MAKILEALSAIITSRPHVLTIIITCGASVAAFVIVCVSLVCPLFFSFLKSTVLGGSTRKTKTQHIEESLRKQLKHVGIKKKLRLSCLEFSFFFRHVIYHSLQVSVRSNV